MIQIKLKILDVNVVNGSDVARFEIIDVETDEDVSDVDIQLLLWSWRDDCQLKEFSIDPRNHCFGGTMMLSQSKAPSVGESLCLSIGKNEDGVSKITGEDK